MCSSDVQMPSFCFMPPESWPVAKGKKSGYTQQLIHARSPLAVVLPEETAKEIEIFRNTQRRVKIASQPLGHESDPGANGAAVTHLGHITTQHLDLSALDSDGASRKAKQCRFSDAVRTDQPRHAAGGNYKIDGIERCLRAVAVGYGSETNGRLTHCGSFTCSSPGQ